jgi:hypothetical protein
VEPELRLDAVADGCDVGDNAPAVDHGCGDVSGNALVIEYYGGVEWDSLQIVDRNDAEGEGRQEIIDEDQLFSLLGLRTEDDEHRSQEQQASIERENGPKNRKANIEEEIDTTRAAIPINDHVPRERILVYDPNNPCMDIGIVYPNMKEFRSAMRQFAINEFKLPIVKSEPQ